MVDPWWHDAACFHLFIYELSSLDEGLYVPEDLFNLFEEKSAHIVRDIWENVP
jgi:hypothetical protein